MSNIKNFIKNFVEEQLVQEDVRTKIKIIERIPNLSADEKQQIIAILNEKPALERVFSNQTGHIDLNKWKTLVMSDFNILFEESDPLKALKDLDKGTDYVQVYGIAAPDLLGVFIPLNWEASQVIASEKVGGIRGHWCIAHSTSSNHWYNYTYGIGLPSHNADSPSIFLIFVFKDNKYALQTCPRYTWITWDKNDNDSGDFDKIPGVDIREVLSKTVKVRNDVRELLDDFAPQFNKGDSVIATIDGSEQSGNISDVYFVDGKPTYSIDYELEVFIKEEDVRYTSSDFYTPIDKREYSIKLADDDEVMWNEHGLEATGTIIDYDEEEVINDGEYASISVISEDGKETTIPITDITYVRNKIDYDDDQHGWVEYKWVDTSSYVDLDIGDEIEDKNGIRGTIVETTHDGYNCECGLQTADDIPEGDIEHV